ncbi:MAG: Crp/Fnr family transcriptional regulator [Chitinispirillaceae bacterium]|nr:Crp/Fnr family transcriptional regulator [Chitinispirillaceae bacterium]
MFHENDRSRELYIIQSGNVRVYRTQNGREVELSVLGKGAVLGEMALIDGRPRSASAKALDDCSVAIVDADAFLDRIRGVPSWFLTVIKMTCQKIRNANRLLQSMGGGRHGVNILLALYYLFARQGESLGFAQTKRAMVRLLGASEQNVARIGDFLVNHGFVECAGDKIVLADRKRFSDYCDFLRLFVQKSYDRTQQPSRETQTLVCAMAEAYPECISASGAAQVQIPGNELHDLVRELDLHTAGSDSIAFMEQNGLVTLKKDENAEAETEKPGSLSAATVAINAPVMRQWYLYCTFNEMMLVL